MKDSPFKEIETELYNFFKEIQNSGLPINGKILSEKAKQIALEKNETEFLATQGWFTRFKKRFNIRRTRFQGEKASVDPHVVETWKKETLPKLILNYDARDIYNCDESAFYYKMLGHNTYGEKGKASSGLKKDKSRITVAFMVNMDGSDFVKPIVIGNSAKPRCFTKKVVLPCHYTSNSTAWMTGPIFSDYLFKFNENLKSKTRKVLLFLDNCSAHNKDLKFSNIKIHFFPKNTTPELQPLDAGIIARIKREYSESLTSKFMTHYIAEEEETKISILDAMTWVTDIFKNLKPELITNCFRKTGFFPNESLDSLEDDEELGLDSQTFIQEKLKNSAIPISNSVKIHLEDLVKTFEESDLHEQTDAEWITDGATNEIVPKNLPIISENSENSQIFEVNPCYLDFQEKSKQKNQICRNLKEARLFILNENLPDCEKWIYTLIKLEKTIMAHNSTKMENQSIEKFLKRAKNNGSRDKNG